MKNYDYKRAGIANVELNKTVITMRSRTQNNAACNTIYAHVCFNVQCFKMNKCPTFNITDVREDGIIIWAAIKNSWSRNHTSTWNIVLTNLFPPRAFWSSLVSTESRYGTTIFFLPFDVDKSANAWLKLKKDKVNFEIYIADRKSYYLYLVKAFSAPLC